MHKFKVSPQKSYVILFITLVIPLFATTLFVSCGPLSPSISKVPAPGSSSLSSETPQGARNDDERVRAHLPFLQESQDATLQVELITSDEMEETLAQPQLANAASSQYEHVEFENSHFEVNAPSGDGTLNATLSANLSRLGLRMGNQLSYHLLLGSRSNAAVQAASDGAINGSLHVETSNDGQRFTLRLSARGISPQAWGSIIAQIQDAHVFSLDHSGK